MTTLASASVLAISLFSATTPENERIRSLAPFFAPPPGSEVTLALDSIPAKDRKKHPETLAGSIAVRPPKGICLTITKRLDTPDVVVCEGRTLAFRAEDLGPDGTLTWQVSTGHGVGTTTISWPSKIRQGKVVDLSMPWPGPGRPIIIASCQAQETFEYGRKIFLRLLSGEKWVIALPKIDTLIEQPPTAPNLYLGEALTGKKGIDADDTNLPNKRIIPRPVFPQDEEKAKAGEWVPVWQTHPRNSMIMSADGFMPQGYATRGLRGRCLYKYAGHPDDPLSGLIECHSPQDYHWVYVPLTCIGDLQPSR